MVSCLRNPLGVDFKLRNSNLLEGDAFLFKGLNLNATERSQTACLQSTLQKKCREVFFPPQSLNLSAVLTHLPGLNI